MTDQNQLLRDALWAFDVFGEADDVPSLIALTQKMEAIREHLSQPAQPAPARLPQGFATSRDGETWRVTLIFNDGDDAKALAGYMDLQGVPAANVLAAQPALAQPQGAGEAVGAVLVDKESREGVAFYSADVLPDPTTIKDRFELVKVYTTPPASQQAAPTPPNQCDTCGAQPASQQAVPTADVPTEWRSTLVRLAFAAKNSIENSGPDPLLKAAIDQACLLLHDPYNYTSQQAAQAVPKKPLFASAVAARKWEELQEQGHRMQLIQFDGGPGGPGTIGTWGGVMWGEPLPTAQTVPDDVRKDAERYQFAMDPENDEFAVCRWSEGDWWPIDENTRIDAAMLRAAKGEQ